MFRSRATYCKGDRKSDKKGGRKGGRKGDKKVTKKVEEKMAEKVTKKWPHPHGIVRRLEVEEQSQLLTVLYLARDLNIYDTGALQDTACTIQGRRLAI